ncbi:MAG: DNA recombination protein RmuC [Clostridiales bacterium]|nr:DNA recombination protein RmuC [Clostridiales bacterium]
MNTILNDTSTLILALILVVGIAAIIVFVSLLTKKSERMQARMLGRLRHENEQQARAIELLGANLEMTVSRMNELSDSMEARQDRLRRTLDERMTLMTQANDLKLDKMRETVSEKLDGRLAESFKAVNSELANVHRGLGEMRELSTGVTDLKKMLGNVKARGVWGEVQLRTLMEQMFSPGQYIENAAIPAGSQTRVEFALKLPTASEAEPLLPIDSKFPQEDYLRLTEAMDSGDRAFAEKCAAQLERAVLEQAKRISDKYIRPPQTVDFAVMFLPVESLYAEVARREGLIERLQQKYRVLVAGPATLCALLTSLQLGLRTCTLEKRSGEILAMMDEFRAEFTRFDESVQRLSQRLDQAGAELDAVQSRAKKISRLLDR